MFIYNRWQYRWEDTGSSSVGVLVSCVTIIISYGLVRCLQGTLMPIISFRLPRDLAVT
jgi:hypothetical protein